MSRRKHYTDSFIRGFWNKVEECNGCLNWIRGKTGRGYGGCKVAGRMVGAHRVAFEISMGRDIKPGMRICHTCDNPACCNPEHLFEGDNGDNMRDCVAKGRHDPSRGAKNGQAKLTEDQVIQIRSMRHKVLYRDISKMFGIKESYIQLIMDGRRWRHI